MAQKSPQRHPNELIELTTAFYSLVDAAAARRARAAAVEGRDGVSHPSRPRRPRRRGVEGGQGLSGCRFYSQIASASLFRSAWRHFSSVAPAQRAPRVRRTIRIKGGKARQNDATRPSSPSLSFSFRCSNRVKRRTEIRASLAPQAETK